MAKKQGQTKTKSKVTGKSASRGLKKATQPKTSAQKKSKARGAAGEGKGTNQARYDQPGAPWWKKFVPRAPR
jgi:hypothetical protein